MKRLKSRNTTKFIMIGIESKESYKILENGKHSQKKTNSEAEI
jgi:hypothetical protein